MPQQRAHARDGLRPVKTGESMIVVKTLPRTCGLE